MTSFLRVGQLRREASGIVGRKQTSSFVTRKLRNQTTRYTGREYITKGRNISPNATTAEGYTYGGKEPCQYESEYTIAILYGFFQKTNGEYYGQKRRNTGNTAKNGAEIRLRKFPGWGRNEHFWPEYSPLRETQHG